MRTTGRFRGSQQRNASSIAEVVNFAKVKRVENLPMSPADTTPPQSPADPGPLPEEWENRGNVTLVLGLLSLVASACATYFLDVIPAMCVVGTVALLTVSVGLLAWVEVGSSKGTWKGRGKTVLGMAAAGLAVTAVILIEFVVVPRIRTEAAKLQSSNNLHVLGMAMFRYHDSNGVLPLAVLKQGGDLNAPAAHSWRVALLPYLLESNGWELYNQYRFNEPWDSPNNNKLRSKMPRCYAAPGKNPADGLTYYQVLVGPRTAFQRNGLPINFAELNKKQSKMICIVEADQPVPWTKPEDIPYDPSQPVPKLGGLFPDGFNVLLSDGTVDWVPRTQDPEALRAKIHR
jgi:hypothetical protein